MIEAKGIINTKGIINEIQQIADYANRTCKWKKTRLIKQNTYDTSCGKMLIIEMDKNEILNRNEILYCEKCGGRIVEVEK